MLKNLHILKVKQNFKLNMMKIIKYQNLMFKIMELVLKKKTKRIYLQNLVKYLMKKHKN